MTTLASPPPPSLPSLCHIPSQRSHYPRFISSSMYIFCWIIFCSSPMMISFVFLFGFSLLTRLLIDVPVYSHQSSFCSSSQEQRFYFQATFFFRCRGPCIRCFLPVFPNYFVKFPLSLFANVCCVSIALFFFFFNNVMHDDVYVTNRSNC